LRKLNDENCAALRQENRLLGKGKYYQYDGKLPGCEIRSADSLLARIFFLKVSALFVNENLTNLLWIRQALSGAMQPGKNRLDRAQRSC